jgi:hypothetical protein
MSIDLNFRSGRIFDSGMQIGIIMHDLREQLEKQSTVPGQKIMMSDREFKALQLEHSNLLLAISKCRVFGL